MAIKHAKVSAVGDESDTSLVRPVDWNAEHVDDNPPWTTGDAKLTFKTVADTGWILANDGSIGNASSGGTTRANADTSALFTLLYNNITALVVQTSAGTPVARGASAAADYAANRRLVIPATLGRALAIAGTGSGLTARTLGGTAGAESVTVGGANMPTNVTYHSGYMATGFSAGGPSNVGLINNWGGSNTPISIMSPATYLNVMIKL